MAGITFDGISSTRHDVSTVSGAVGQATVGSYTNLRGTYASTEGAVVSASTGSPATFGARVQAGVAGPLLAATGSLRFGTAFVSSDYALTVTGQTSGTLPWFVLSGTGTYSTSGATVQGQSGLSFYWVAVGL